MLAGLERLEAGGVAVVHGDNLAGAIHLELHEIVRSRDSRSIPICDPHGDEGEILSVRLDGGAVRGKGKFFGFAGRLHDVSGPLLAILVGDHLEFARLVFYIVPDQAEIHAPLFGLAAK